LVSKDLGAVKII